MWNIFFHYVLQNKACLCGRHTVNCCWNCFFGISWGSINDFTCGSLNFLRQRKQPTKYQHLGIVPLISKEEAHSEPSQTYKRELFTNIVNGWKHLTIFGRGSIINVWLFSEYTTIEYHWSCMVMFVGIIA